MARDQASGRERRDRRGDEVGGDAELSRVPLAVGSPCSTRLALRPSSSDVVIVDKSTITWSRSSIDRRSGTCVRRVAL
jgi:hypothetical protein